MVEHLKSHSDSTLPSKNAINDMRISDEPENPEVLLQEKLPLYESKFHVLQFNLSESCSSGRPTCKSTGSLRTREVRRCEGSFIISKNEETKS